ncbi:MAG: Tol-Pal system protein TolB [Pseudomonadales bacterium]|nr:Tol-Pal system protein TolB [Pseudomonadales bacterium]MCP5173216.1 Tol-Pal system protein TolB [Pseudomonadales bacterium]
MKFVSRFICVLIALLLPTLAMAELTIEITQGADNPTRIAIPPLGGSALPEDVSAIVAADLERSGLFRPVPKRDMLSFPSTPDEVYYRDWSILGTEYLLVSRSFQQNGNFEIQFSLIEVHSRRKVFSRTVNGPASKVRNLAHHISDKVYEAVTGIRGAFSTRIVYITAVPDQQKKMTYRLMVSDADGARERLLLESREPIMSPAWSPDGKEIVYVSFETGRPAIFRQELATAKRQQVTNFRGLNGAPAWSPDGRKLALVLSKDGNPEIYTYDLITREFTRLTRHFSIDTEPNWTPDGKSLIFTSDRGGSPQIYKLTVATGGVERLTFRGSYNARPRLAPDGRTMVMVHRDNGRFHIASQDLVTNDLRVLTQTRLDESPTVAPNGAMLLYATKQGPKGVLAAVSLDAGVKFLLPAKRGDVREPAWSPFLD